MPDRGAEPDHPETDCRLRPSRLHFPELGCEAAPFILRFVLVPLMEQNLRRGDGIFGGDFSIFATRALLLATLGLVSPIVMPRFRPDLRGRRSRSIEGWLKPVMVRDQAQA